MKKLLLILMLLIPSMALADITKQLTTAGADCSVPTNCVTHNIATYSGATVTLSGTFIATVRFEASSDGTVWSAITGYPVTTGAGVTLATTPGNWQFSVGGLKFLRVRCSAITTPPTVNIVGSMGSYTPPASVGAITVGAVDQGTGGASAWLVDGTGGTFPITSAGTLNVAGTGTAGTPGTAVLTVQGIGSGTAVPISGTVTATSTGTDNITALGGGTLVAVGSAVAGTPLPITGKAVATQPAVVDAGDANFLSVTTDGRLIIKEAAPPQDEWQYTAVITDGNEFTVKAGEANYYLVVTAVLVINSHASVGTVVTFKNATGGTAIYQGYAASGGGGWSQGNGVGSLFIVPTAGNGLFGICATTGSATAVNIRGYKTKVAP